MNTLCKATWSLWNDSSCPDHKPQDVDLDGPLKDRSGWGATSVPHETDTASGAVKPLVSLVRFRPWGKYHGSSGSEVPPKFRVAAEKPSTLVGASELVNQCDHFNHGLSGFGQETGLVPDDEHYFMFPRQVWLVTECHLPRRVWSMFWNLLPVVTWPDICLSDLIVRQNLM